MKVLIMAAGIGSRISRHLNGKPKCCVKINQLELISYTFALLNKKGITDIAIVTGYAEQCIFDVIKEYQYQSYTNNFFDITNSIASAWFAKDFLDASDDLIIMNADVFIEEKIIDVLLAEKDSPLFLADSSRIEQADYKFNWKDNKLVQFGKQLSIKETTGEYVGIARINSNDIPFMKEKLNQMIKKQNHDFWWEDIFYQSLSEKEIFIHDIKGVFWAEVDYIEDYERIKSYLKSQINYG
ncbi:MAG: phosphocholine cytidylyltransferase family protein [Pseudomonadota bacterium]